VSKRDVIGRPFAVALQGEHAYVVSTGVGKLRSNVGQYSVATGEREDGVEGEACSLATGRYGVWMAGCPNVQQLITEGTDLALDDRVVTIPLVQPSSAANFREALPSMAEGEGSVWVIGDAADRRLYRIDPRQRKVVATVPLGFPPAALTVGADAVWVTDELGDRVVRIDPSTNRIVAAIPVDRGAQGVAFGAGSVWVACSVAHAVTRIDPRSNRVLATVPVAASPRAVAVDRGKVWVVGDAR
jgi:streptogramin lyase